MKTFAQPYNLVEPSFYSKSDIQNTFGTLDLTSDDTLNNALGLYAIICSNATMQTNELLSNYHFDKEINLNNGGYIGHGTSGNTSIIAIFGQEQRNKVTQYINNIYSNNLDIDEFSNLPFYNLKEYLDEYNNNIKNKFTGIKDNVILLSQGNNYPLSEILLNDLQGTKNFYSLCINPGKSLLAENYITDTVFYYYDNPRSNFIPDELYKAIPQNVGVNIDTKVKLNLPQCNFITYTGTEKPISDIDKCYPIFFAINNKKGNSTTGDVNTCKDYYTFDDNYPNTLPVYTNVIPGTTFNQVAKDICKVAISAYLEGDNLTNYSVTFSKSKNIVSIKDNNNNVLIVCNKVQSQVIITGDLMDVTTNSVTYSIDKSFNRTKNIIETDFNTIKSALNTNLTGAGQVIILAINCDIHAYLNIFYSELSMPANSYLILLGTSSITRGFPGFNQIGFKDSKVINMLNDMLVMTTNDSREIYNTYDDIESNITYDVNVDTQTCLNTIFGYTHYLGN